MNVDVASKAQKRFWAKVDQQGDCWTWTAAACPRGYGRFQYDGHLVRAHRFAFATFNGSIPSGMEVDHICHNPSCVRPAHLRLTTHKQNLEHQVGPHSGNASGHRGVSWRHRSNAWRASVRHNGRDYDAGLFSTAEAAGAAAKELRLELFTHNDADRAKASA